MGKFSKDFKRPAIKQEERLKLWVQSGGRCAICNKYMLEDEHFEVPLGEMAHIVAWQEAKKAPRSKSPLSADERNKADNLMLLCAEHHKIIDYKNLPDLFTIQKLLDQKRQHEARILHLTNFKKDSETTVIRMFSNIRGSGVELSRTNAFEVVWKSNNRYASFPLAFDKASIEINLNHMPDPNIDTWQTYWKSGCVEIDACIAKLNEGIKKDAVRHLSLFAFARIPFLVYLGYHIDDKIPTDIFQKHRNKEESWFWSEDENSIDFEYNQIQLSESVEKIALILSVSGSIAATELPINIDKSYNIFEIKPIGITPHRNIISTKKSLLNFSNCYHQFLSHLEQSYKVAKKIHLFPAVPISVAIICGRGIMREAQPAIEIYDRYQDKYLSTLTINSI